MQISKDVEKETPVPLPWRNTVKEIVEAFKGGTFKVHRVVEGIRPVEQDVAEAIAENIEDYGCKLTTLPNETWETSVCQWMDGYWEIIVDLFTEEEGASDLVLDLQVFESGSGYEFEIQLVYVP